jgi:hypothetical protein
VSCVAVFSRPDWAGLGEFETFSTLQAIARIYGGFMANVFPNLGKAAALEVLLASPTVFTLHLYKNSLVIDRDTILADLDEADFDGYSEEDISTWGTIYIDPVDNAATSDADETIFLCASSSTPNIIYGAYFTDQIGDLWWIDEFSAPQVMGDSGNTFGYSPQFKVESKLNN